MRLTCLAIAVSGLLAAPALAAVVTPPAWIRIPTEAERQIARPVGAHKEGAQVWMKCTVTVEGVLTDCSIIKESPPNLGFGKSTLSLASKFRMRPQMLDGKPVGGAAITVPFSWYGDKGTIEVQQRLAKNLLWDEAPTSADVAAAYPKDALAKGRSGKVVLRCAVFQNGRLNGCKPSEAGGADRDFLAAAQSLLPKFKAIVGDQDQVALLDLRVDVTFQFTPAATAAAPRYLPKADWTHTLTSEALLGAFPNKATAAGLNTGRGMVDCTVGQGGKLTACTPVSEEPAGVDFGVSAIQLAQAMVTNPWTAEGLPTEGAHLRVPIRFQAKDIEPSAPAVTAPTAP